MALGGWEPNGETGIRTPDTGLTPYNGLANRRLQPLGHLSGERRKLRRPGTKGKVWAGGKARRSAGFRRYVCPFHDPSAFAPRNASRMFRTTSAGSGPFSAYATFLRAFSGFVVP